MVSVRVVAFAYRNWALKALNRVVEHQPDVDLHVFKEPGQATARLCERLNPALVLFYGWSWIVPDDVVDNWMCVCLHPSPLPKYRGGSPVQHQIIDGQTESAVTFFRMTKELDAGPICAQVPLSLEGTLREIFDRIAAIAVVETLRFVRLLGEGKDLAFREQEGEPSTYRRRKPKESRITQEELGHMPARYLHDKIRALSIEGEDYPAAFVVCADGEKLYLTESKLEKG